MAGVRSRGAAGGREEGQLSTRIGDCCGVGCSTGKVCWVRKWIFVAQKKVSRDECKGS